MAKPIIVSGIQPTGPLHLGNYLGALKNFVSLQNSRRYRCFFFVADYHSLTENFSPREKRRQILNLAADYLAAGLDPRKSVIFLQSQTPASTELAWIFNTLAPLGELKRMTQFKEKSEEQRENANAGLLTYPLLMAADILLYDAEAVPVGEDQLQHLELARTLARKFNRRFGSIFTEPKPLLAKTPRLMSLDDPFKKMSKSLPAGCLFLDDPAAAIREKIKRAVTDSGREIKYDPRDKPAVSNLILIYAELAGLTAAQIEKKFRNKGYAEFKESLAETVIGHFAPFRERKVKISSKEIKNVIKRGSKAAGRIAGRKIGEVKKKIGVAL